LYTCLVVQQQHQHQAANDDDPKAAKESESRTPTSKGTLLLLALIPEQSQLWQDHHHVQLSPTTSVITSQNKPCALHSCLPVVE
jgi:hypothetical protein